MVSGLRPKPVDVACHLVCRRFVMVHGTQQDTTLLTEEIAHVLTPLGLRLPAAKNQVVHVDERFNFLGFRIQRAFEKETAKSYVYTFIGQRAQRRGVRGNGRTSGNHPR